jgi:hypothetical protein
LALAVEAERDVSRRIKAMTDRTDDKAVGGGDPTSPSDETFEARDARLNKEMSGFDRARAGSKGAEFPHDETYTPGYHQGGTRFGFFNGRDEPKAPPKDDKGGGKG